MGDNRSTALGKAVSPE